MAEQKHTPEPWHQFAFEVYDGDNCIIADCGYAEDIIGKDGMKANAARIVACVNALAGIENPEEWVKQAKLLMANKPKP